MNNLQKIKNIALAFLNMPISFTQFNFIISHPFTSTPIIPINTEQILNILNEEERIIWKEKIKDEIEKSTSALDLFTLLNKPYYLAFLKYTHSFLTPEEIGEILGNLWTSIEYCSADKNITNKQLINLFKKADKKSLMSEEELKYLDNLPEKVTIYRGVTTLNKKNTRALSWTTDKATAEWFSNRFNSNGVVWEQEISKEKILCCFLNRKEFEVIVNLYK